jgi:hypothetical protein
MRISLRHHQALVTKKLCDVFEFGALLSEAARSRVPQIMPAKPRNLSILHGSLKPSAWASKRLAGTLRSKNTTSGAASPPHFFKRLYGVPIQSNM